MTESYDPDPGLTPVYPYDAALLSQRDLGLRVPINYVTVPGVSLSAACFSNLRFEDDESGDCVSNLLAVGFRRLEIDLYWDQGRQVWSFCPVAIPSTVQVGLPDTTSFSSFTSSTALALSSIDIASFSALSSASVNARQLSTASPFTSPVTSSDLSSGFIQTSSASLDTSATFPSSVGADSASTSNVPDSSNNPLVSIGPYTCSATINLSTFTSQLLSYIEDTDNNLQAQILYVIINIHAAATDTAPNSPASSPTSPPQLIGPLFNANISDYLYTPTNLRSDRADLNGSWNEVDSLQRPVDGYYSTQAGAHNIYSTQDGWPTEYYLEFHKSDESKRLLLGWGTVDPQMTGYNFTGDEGTIFPNGYIQDLRTNVTTTSAGQITHGCFLRSDQQNLAQVNSSWANDVDLPGFAYPTSATANITPLLNLTTNTTNCGISSNLNVTLLNVTANDNPTIYRNYTAATIWSWASGEPRDYNSSSDAPSEALFRCATSHLSLSGRWVVSDCSAKYYVACQDPKYPYNWTVNTYPVSYSYASQACPDHFAFAAPRTALENSYLTQAMRDSHRDYDGHGVFVNFNSLDFTDCWVTGGPNTTCPYLGQINETEDYKKRTVLVPSIAALIVLIVTVLTVGVKIAGNRKVRKRTNKRVRAMNGFIYEGVPS